MTATVHPIRPRNVLRCSMTRRDYAEASYFDGFHFQHIADWQEHNRLKRAERVHATFRRRHSNIAGFWK